MRTDEHFRVRRSCNGESRNGEVAARPFSRKHGKLAGKIDKDRSFSVLGAFLGTLQKCSNNSEEIWPIKGLVQGKLDLIESWQMEGWNGKVRCLFWGRLAIFLDSSCWFTLGSEYYDKSREWMDG